MGLAHVCVCACSLWDTCVIGSPCAVLLSPSLMILTRPHSSKGECGQTRHPVGSRRAVFCSQGRAWRRGGKISGWALFRLLCACHSPLPSPPPPAGRQPSWKLRFLTRCIQASADLCLKARVREGVLLPPVRGRERGKTQRWSPVERAL